jgi:hypothetical protein
MNSGEISRLRSRQQDAAQRDNQKITPPDSKHAASDDAPAGQQQHRSGDEHPHQVDEQGTGGVDIVDGLGGDTDGSPQNSRACHQPETARLE